MFIAWFKLRQRNIAPILDASGWAVNGNVRITIPLGALLTQVGVRPKGSRFDPVDPYVQKKFPVKRVVLCAVLAVLVVVFVVAVLRSPTGISGVWGSIKDFFGGIGRKFVPQK